MFLKVTGIPKRSYPENKISKPPFTKAKVNTVHINRKALILLKVSIIAHNKNAAVTEDRRINIPQTAVRRIRPKLNLAHHTSQIEGNGIGDRHWSPVSSLSIIPAPSGPVGNMPPHLGDSRFKQANQALYFPAENLLEIILYPSICGPCALRHWQRPAAALRQVHRLHHSPDTQLAVTATITEVRTQIQLKVPMISNGQAVPGSESSECIGCTTVQILSLQLPRPSLKFGLKFSSRYQ